MNYGLPTSVTIGDIEYKIRSDYRVILEIFSALNDAELSDEDKAIVTLGIFYEDAPPMTQEAIDKCFWFINGGEMEQKTKAPVLVNWEQDFHLIVAPINRVCGKDVRGVEYLHWWTFLSCYMEIGECLFAEVVSIRDKKARGKRLEKSEQEFYKRNRHLVDIKRTYTEAEQDLIDLWT